MTRHDEPALLTAQLEAALAGAAADPHEAIEAAALAGLRARVGADDALQAAASRLHADPVELAEAAEDAAEALAEVEEDDGPDLGWDRLCQLDEVCAAAWWLGQAEVVRPSVALAVGVVHAFPEPWAPLAPAASRLLAEAPPVHGDPALALWRAVEVARLPAPEAVDEPSELVLDDALAALGLRTLDRLRLSDVTPVSLVASGGAPPRPPWEVIAAGAGWELVLTQGEPHEPVLLLATELEVPPEVRHDGASATVEGCPDGWTWPAAPGAWRVQWGGETVRFELDP